MTNEATAKQIIKKILYITIATVSAENQPWNTPVYSSYDEDFTFYWASDQNSEHSQNIAQNNKVFLVIYDSTVQEGKGEGVYVQATASIVEEEEEVTRALTYLYTRKGDDPDKRTAEEFMGEHPRRVYKAVPEKMWINGNGDINGNYIDVRLPVNLPVLIRSSY